MCGNRHGGCNEIFKKNNKTEDLDGEEAKYILKKKILELALKICINKKRFLKENTNKIYGIVFGKCALSLQSVLKGFTDHDSQSKDCDYFLLMEEQKKITS